MMTNQADYLFDPTAAEKPTFAAGDQVRVHSGVLEGLGGTILDYGTSSRLIIAVNLNCEGVTVEIDEGLLDLTPPPSSAPTCPKPPENRGNQQSTQDAATQDAAAEPADDLAFCASLLEADFPELAHVIAAWPGLSEEARRAIAALGRTRGNG